MDKVFRVLIALVAVPALLGAAGEAGPPRGGGVDSFVGSTAKALNDSVEVDASRRIRDASPEFSDSESRKKIAATGSGGGHPLTIREIVARLCAGGAPCTGRDTTGFNPVFFEAADAPDADRPIEGEQPARVVTIDDLARFLPATVGFHAEPDGWAVVGVPANFWTYVQPVTVEGVLLGEEAAVRFTPRLYEWNYGDGTTAVTRTGGSSWAGAGQEELTATPTGHVYSAKATVQASVTVIWSAEYRFAGGDWIGVEGAVSNSSPDERMLVVKERTVLTARGM